jgi:hypothetical protein
MLMPVLRSAPLLALLLLGGCVSGYGDTYAPNYPPGYDAGMGSGQYYKPGDQFGGQDVASIDVFYQALAPYGRWVDSRYGRGFQPQTASGWRPYVNGRWGENRLWISDDPWGWATDHYGRWGHDDRIGWVWIPGTQWAPSWVAWRDTDDVAGQNVLGWAPIPPGVSYSVGVGFGSGFGFNNWNSWYAPSWVWVPRNYLYRPGFGGGVLPWNNGFNYWNNSRWNYNSGWNGRPGYGRPNYNRPDYGRPNTGHPNSGRPDYGRPDYDRPGYNQPGNGRPPGARPPGYGNRPGEAGNWNGNRPDRQNWQGRPGDGASPNRPGGYERPNREPGTRTVRPPRVATAVPPGGGTPPAYAPPPRAERPPPPARVDRAPPPARVERSTESRSNINNGYERPQ